QARNPGNGVFQRVVQVGVGTESKLHKRPIRISGGSLGVLKGSVFLYAGSDPRPAVSETPHEYHTVRRIACRADPGDLQRRHHELDGALRLSAALARIDGGVVRGQAEGPLS